MTEYNKLKTHEEYCLQLHSNVKHELKALICVEPDPYDPSKFINIGIGKQFKGFNKPFMNYWLITTIFFFFLLLRYACIRAIFNHNFFGVFVCAWVEKFARKMFSMLFVLLDYGIHSTGYSKNSNWCKNTGYTLYCIRLYHLFFIHIGILMGNMIFTFFFVAAINNLIKFHFSFHWRHLS